MLTPGQKNASIVLRALLAALALLAVLAPLSACGGRSRANFIVAGSTSVQPYAEILSEDYAHIYPDRIIDVQGGGSSAGIRAVISGAADIGMSSRYLKEDEAYLWSAEIAKDGLAVIVHPDNPVSDLTLDGVRAVYSGEAGGWDALGGAASGIHLITREEGSGTRDVFESLVMAGLEITPRAIVQDSNGAVKQLVSNDRNAIGFISLGLVDGTVKALRLGGVEASHENVASGAYSLYRPFLFITDGEPADLAKEFIDYTLSGEGRRILTNEGLITLAGGGGK